MLSASVGEQTMGSLERLWGEFKQTSCPTAPPSPEIFMVLCKSEQV